MTEDERNQLLLDIAEGLRIVIGLHLGEATSLSNHKLRILHDKLQKMVKVEMLGGVPGPYNFLKDKK